jgi:hypothetical protein
MRVAMPTTDRRVAVTKCSDALFRHNRNSTEFEPLFRFPLRRHVEVRFEGTFLKITRAERFIPASNGVINIEQTLSRSMRCDVNQ